MEFDYTSVQANIEKFAAAKRKLREMGWRNVAKDIESFAIVYVKDGKEFRLTTATVDNLPSE